MRSLLWAAACLLLLGGCLPSSCQSGDFDSITPADSLSRSIAEEMPADSLQLAWSLRDEAAYPLGYPRMVQRTHNDTLVVADVERNSLHYLHTSGTYEREYAHDAFDVPFLSGTVADTLWVFNAETDSLVAVANGAVLPDRGFRISRADEASLVYTAAHPDNLYLKLLGEDIGSTLYQYTWDGAVEGEHTLEQPFWRYAGFLRIHEDQLWSLSGFRPVLDRFPLDLNQAPTTPADTVALRGFDSPMLERSHAFLIGDTHEPPLLSTSAVVQDNLWFVLNMRSGWIQVDVFDMDGELQHRLMEANPQPDSDFFPQDMTVYPHNEGYKIVFAISDPEPEVRAYHWHATSDS